MHASGNTKPEPEPKAVFLKPPPPPQIAVADYDSPRTECEYCGAPVAPTFFMSMAIYRWCGKCQQDLKDFAAMQDYTHRIDITDEFAVAHFRSEIQRRQDEFMHQRLIERGTE